MRIFDSYIYFVTALQHTAPLIQYCFTAAESGRRGCYSKMLTRIFSRTIKPKYQGSFSISNRMVRADKTQFPNTVITKNILKLFFTAAESGRRG